MHNLSIPKNRRPGPSNGQISTAPILGGRAVTLGDWGDIWYADYRSQVQPSTYYGYQFTLQIIKKWLGDALVADVLPIHINLFMTELMKSGYGMSQIHKCRTMLIQLFDAAEDNNLISRNPARRAKIIRDLDGSLTEPRYEKDAFTDLEVELLRRDLPDDLLGNSIRLLLDTGLRVQELIALAPEDIAEDGSSVTVNKAIKMVADIPQLGPPKSRHAYRTVPVPEESRACALYLKRHGGQTLIWSLPGRNPYYSVRCFRRRYCNALNRVEGVRCLPPHCCRHTYVTRLQAEGIPLEMIARLAGHSNSTETDAYAHPSMKTLAEAVSVLHKKED